MAGKKKLRGRTSRGKKYSSGWGGARPGAGRPPDPNSGEPHTPRPSFRSRTAAHATLQLVEGLPSLRSALPKGVVLDCLRSATEREELEPTGFRVVHFSLQRDRIELLVEADEPEALARGMQGLCIRISRNLNRELGRSGSVFADRYGATLVRTPAELRAALAIVLPKAGKSDSSTSAAWARSARPSKRKAAAAADEEPPPVLPARTPLLRKAGV